MESERASCIWIANQFLAHLAVQAALIVWIDGPWIFISILHNYCNLTSIKSQNWRHMSFLMGCIVLYNIVSNRRVARQLSKALRMIVDAPCYVPNTVIRRDLQIPTFKE
jgi:hypothetical protein